MAGLYTILLPLVTKTKHNILQSVLLTTRQDDTGSHRLCSVEGTLHINQASLEAVICLHQRGVPKETTTFLFLSFLLLLLLLNWESIKLHHCSDTNPIVIGSLQKRFPGSSEQTTTRRLQHVHQGCGLEEPRQGHI